MATLRHDRRMPNQLCQALSNAETAGCQKAGCAIVTGQEKGARSRPSEWLRGRC
jgi:hypothetical protein